MPATMIDRCLRVFSSLALSAALFALSGSLGHAQDAAAPLKSAPQSLPQLPPGMAPGYLAPDALPDSLSLLPPPPAPGSPGFARDEAMRTSAQALKGTPRWSLAISDADLQLPHAAKTFSCAANIPISKEQTPHLYTLISRSFVDLGLSTYRAKDYYQRVRPFVMHHETTCTPADEAKLAKNGSYPSGHSTLGWGWALILTELVPDNTNAIQARGRDFGESRIICNVHWQSDVDAGRVVAAATVARLHADSGFQADLAAAKDEITGVRASGAKPDAALCAAESTTLRAEP
jgi:acid phosphatase (class A)